LPRIHVSLVLLLFAAAIVAAYPPLAVLAQPIPAEATPAAEQVTEPPGWLGIIFSGGPVGIAIMLCLFALSVTAAYLVFENALSIRKKQLLPEGLDERVRQLLLAGRVAEAEQACKAQPSYLAFVLRHGLAEIEGGWSDVEKALEDAVAEQSARLFRRIEYLSVIGNIAPMLGLLGTVTGMIMAFMEISNRKGNAGAAELAEGIYSALVTTVAGLVIAIPCFGAFAIFRNRVDELVAEAAYLAVHVFSPLKKRKAGQTPPVAPPASAPAAKAPQPPQPPPAPPTPPAVKGVR
jgi:biopolymer transport protein ExbB